MKRIICLAALLLCLTLLLAACGAGDGSITIKTDGMRFVKEEVHFNTSRR